MISTIFVVFASFFASAHIVAAIYWASVGYGFWSHQMRTADARDNKLATRLCWLQVRHSLSKAFIWLVVVLAVLIV